MEFHLDSYTFKEHEQKNSFEEVETPLFLLLLFAIPLALYVFELKAFAGYFFLSVIVSAHFYVFLTKNNKPEKTLGSFPQKIMITDEKIQIGSEEFSLNKISGLKINCNDFKGKNSLLRYFFGVRYTQKLMGVRNSLKFNFQGKNHFYNFLIKSEKDFYRVNAFSKKINDTQQ